MALTEKQRERVQALVDGDWLVLDDDEDEDTEATEEAFGRLFNAIDSAEELHEYAHEFHWDDDLSVLNRILEHPLCDRGTALMIYWLAKPGWYVQYDDRASIPKHELESFQLIESVRARLLEGSFRTSSQPFDPRNDLGTDLTNLYPELDPSIANLKNPPILPIPPSLHTPVTGS